jgi:hypothetical protein
VSAKPNEKPQPQWPDISKPDTRGGGGGDQKKATLRRGRYARLSPAKIAQPSSSRS